MDKQVIDSRRYNLRVVIYAAPDVPGQWVAHCLEFDLVTVGNSPEHADEMIRDALQECILDDLNADLDPMGRSPADTEVWDLFDRVHLGGQRCEGMTPPAGSKPEHFVFIVFVGLDFVQYGSVEARKPSAIFGMEAHAA